MNRDSLPQDFGAWIARHLCALFLAGAMLAPSLLPADEAARQIIQRSVPFIEREGMAWIQEKDCLSCHGKVEPTSVFWGTCWAVIGLSETFARPSLP